MDNNTFENVSWGHIGIEISDLEKTLENPDTVNVPSGTIKHDWVNDGRPSWKPNKAKLSNGRKVFWFVAIALSVIVLLISSMLGNI